MRGGQNAYAPTPNTRERERGTKRKIESYFFLFCVEENSREEREQRAGRERERRNGKVSK